MEEDNEEEIIIKDKGEISKPSSDNYLRLMQDEPGLMQDYLTLLQDYLGLLQDYLRKSF